MSKSGLTRSERIEKACELYARAYSPTDVARKLKVARNTAIAYRVIYESRMQKAVNDDPGFLTDIVGNTMRMLVELDQTRSRLNKDADMVAEKFTVECDNCGHEILVKSPNFELRAKIIGQVLKAQDMRAKLFGTLGVKAEFMQMVAITKRVQDMIIKFMSEELCERDMAKLKTLLNSPAMLQYMRSAALTEVESWEVEPQVEITA